MNRGVVTGWTGLGWTCPPTFARGCSWDWCKSGEFLRGGVSQVWSLTRQSLPYINFKVAVLEFAYKWRWLWIVWRKYSTCTWQWLSLAYIHCSCISMEWTVWHYDLLTYLLVCVTYGRHDVKFINWHASCLLYPLAVLALNEPSVNFASWKTSCAVRLMGDERLNGLMLMAVEKNIVKDLDLQKFVDTFALKPRKLKLYSRLDWNFSDSVSLF